MVQIRVTKQKDIGELKIESVIQDLAQYLDCPESIPLSQRVSEVEMRLDDLESFVKAKY